MKHKAHSIFGLLSATLLALSAFSFVACEDDDSNDDSSDYSISYSYAVEYTAASGGTSQTKTISGTASTATDAGLSSLYAQFKTVADSITGDGATVKISGTSPFYDGILKQFKDVAHTFSLDLSGAKVTSTTSFYGSSVSAAGAWSLKNLTALTLPSTLTKLPVFKNCIRLASVSGYEANSLTEIANETFSNTALTTFTVGTGVTKIGTKAFAYTLTDLNLSENGLTSADKSALSASKLTNVTFPSGTNWYATTTYGAASGTDITVTETATNATNLKDTNGSWYNSYLYKK